MKEKIKEHSEEKLENDKKEVKKKSKQKEKKKEERIDKDSEGEKKCIKKDKSKKRKENSEESSEEDSEEKIKQKKSPSLKARKKERNNKDSEEISSEEERRKNEKKKKKNKNESDKSKEEKDEEPDKKQFLEKGEKEEKEKPKKSFDENKNKEKYEEIHLGNEKEEKKIFNKEIKQERKSNEEKPEDNFNKEENKEKEKKKNKKHKKKYEEEYEEIESEKEEKKNKSKKKSHKKKYEEESEESSEYENKHKKSIKKHHHLKKEKKKKNKYEESSSDEEDKPKKSHKHKQKKKENSISDSSDSENEKIKKKKNKKRNKKEKKIYSESDSSESDSDSEEEKRHKIKSKKNKKRKYHKITSSDDSSYSEVNKSIESSEDSEDSRYKKSRKKTEIRKKHKRKKDKKKDDSSNSDSTPRRKDKEKRKNRFSQKGKNESSSSSKSKRSKSSITYKEKEKQNIKKEKLNESISSFDSDKDKNIADASKNEINVLQNKKDNLIHLESEERIEKNVSRKSKIIKDIKKTFDELIPKNQSGKFLLDEKNNNQDNQKLTKKIIDNFLKADSVIKQYIKEFKSDEEKKEFFKKQGFILTEKSMERMALLIHYILNGIPVLLEGNTGTSKTRTALTACNYIKKFIKKNDENNLKLIRYNLSAETKIDDIIAKYVSDQNSITGLTVRNGPFVEAYVKGKIILFDEINLAPANVLQCIQQSLDNNFLSVETNGRCLLKFKKNPNFALVATQNPNKGAFEGKRQELGTEFLSRFQRIYYPDITKEEMKEIAIGIAKNVGYLNSDDENNKYKKKLLKDIVNLHFDWAKETSSQTDFQCFTIREIESVIECLSNKEDPYYVIMTIYGGRFKQKRKDELKLKLFSGQYEILKSLKVDEMALPNNFPKCFINDSLIQTVNSVLLALRNKRNVIIVGNDESGLTQVAEWCSEYFNKEIKSEKTDEKFICFCTKNLECSDLIGTQKITDSSEDENELIKFEPRFLYEAIENGNCVVLDSINEAPSRVIERLNGLLDKKNSKKEEKFEVPENSAKPKININNDFRIICTSQFDKINQISPAFVNRFEVIVLEDQLKGVGDSGIEEFIKLMCNKYQEECHYNYKNIIEKIKKSKSLGKENFFDPFSNFDGENMDKEKIKIDKKIEVTQDMLDLIMQKIRILSKGRNPNQTLDDSISVSSLGDKEVDEISKKYLTMSSINKFCRTIVILINKFKNLKYITIESIIDFSFELLFEEHLSDKNDKIQKFLIEELTSQKIRDLGEEKYYFEKSESLKRFMVQMYACSLVNQYLCVIGPPGIGKTIGARAFSFIREVIFGITYESPFYMHTFNQFTRPSDYFGISSLKDEKLIFREGTLTKSIKEGNVFIGDEFNISSEDCMKAITPILELKFREDILIPGIEKKISIDPDFFFIICQNTKEIFGRKDLPEKIKIKIKVINYPDRIKEEIENICESISENLFKEEEQKKITSKDARLCGDFLMSLNQNEVLTPWSLRDISKLFARIYKQSKNPKNYEGLGLHENILFYILSSTNDSLVSERLPVVVDLISETFKLNAHEKKDLLELYNSPPYIKPKNGKIFIEKGNVSIYYCNNTQEKFKQLNGLQNILNALFKILITSDDEPILISGPSSFKTFLAQLLFKNEKSEIISLNSETTISQLIGSSTLLTAEKAKNYYLLQIYEILQANNIDNLLKDLEDFETNEEKIRNKIEELTKHKKIDENYSFYYALNNFKNKLFKKEKDKKSLFDMIIEFKPGIFLSARIRGYNLILKNITYVKTENLERLNEALTGNKKITLNEDTQNSFTPENDKEINFSNDFRVVGTCNEGEETSLSEAFLSRFTLIYVNKYSEDEELKVLKASTDDIKDIDFLNQLLDKYYTAFPDMTKINLSQKINCFKITKEIDKISNNNPHQENLKLVCYYLLKGLNEKREETINEINNIFDIKNYYDDKANSSPVEKIKNKEESPIIKSKLNGLIMNINPQIENEDKFMKNEEKTNLFFTNKIKGIIDVIHFSLCSKTPLILEGGYGQGKKSSIEYYAKMVKLELVQVQISKSTKVDDLLCKTTFKKNEKGNVCLVNSKTPLCNAIECIDNFPNKLVILEGINNATPAVLEILNLIYSKKGTNILLPNGSKIVKGNINLISIFNPSDDFTREKLPANLLNNALYYIVEDPSKNDIVNIISYLFKEAKLEKSEKTEHEEFSKNFLKAQKIAKEGTGEFPLTLHEVRKYISFRKANPFLDKTIFMTFIINYHFSQRENIIKAQKELKLDNFLFNQTINYDGDKKYLTFKTSKKGKKNLLKIKIKNPDKIKTRELINKFNTMTLTEKLCFLFLICCVNANKTPIIQGPTSSGKSFIIKLFSEVLGQDLSIYQLNANS